MITYIVISHSTKDQVVEQQLQINNHEQTITEFVHDIKTPVTTMKLLIDQETDEQRKKRYYLSGRELMRC